MRERLKKIFRLSTLFKAFTVCCIIGLILAYLSPYVHPKTFWMIPFFGLAYPVIILCALVLLVIWAIAKSKWFFILLFFILVGGRLHFRIYSSPFDGNTGHSEKALKLVSYNVRNFDVYNADFNKDFKNRDGIFHLLSKMNADIVCFQEFYYQDEKHKFPTKDTLFKILKARNYHDRMSFNKKYKNYFGVAMYSKYPMLTKGFIELDSSNLNSNNFCIFADIVKATDTFRVYNVHFQSIRFQQDDYALFDQHEYTGATKSGVINMLRKIHRGYQRRADQAMKVFDHMQQSPYPVLICGDFNDTPMSYVYNVFYSKYIDAFRNSSSGLGVTYAGKVPAGRIDYVFHSEEINSINFKVYKEVFSDHKAISCEFWKK